MKQNKFRLCIAAFVVLSVSGMAFRWVTWPERTWDELLDSMKRRDKARVNAIFKAGSMGEDLTDDPGTASLFLPYMSPRPFRLRDRLTGTAGICQCDPSTDEIAVTMLIIERGVVYFHPARYGLERSKFMPIAYTYSKGLSDADPNVRRAALHAIGDMGTAGTHFLPRVHLALHDEDEGVRRKAKWAVTEISRASERQSHEQ